jgi:hypothetical protein
MYLCEENQDLIAAMGIYRMDMGLGRANEVERSFRP